MNDILKTDTLDTSVNKINDNFDELEMMDRTIDSKIDSKFDNLNTKVENEIPPLKNRLDNLVDFTFDTKYIEKCSNGNNLEFFNRKLLDS